MKMFTIFCVLFIVSALINCGSSQEETCEPFKTLEDVMNWKPCFERKHFSHDLRKRITVPNAPKLLVCHDMNGGYTEDRYLNGVQNDNYYYFVHWSTIDTFVYFSHHLVTVPPSVWISAAHKNGVQILGTFITEWDAGSEICDRFLVDEKSIHGLSEQLAQMASFYNFDGWLINIENNITQSQVPRLELFVESLTKEMHRAKPNSVVLWYDSVIDTGLLWWQNALIQNNRNFFDSSDGIFLNYDWTEKNLNGSAAIAGSRKTDVYVGVDVYGKDNDGRGCSKSGGGFSSNNAVEIARRYGFSVAIFAPGWVHECLGGKYFTENQFIFWDKLAEFSTANAIKRSFYSSSFCPGFGDKMYRKGKVLSEKPWFNLALQAPQPSYHLTRGKGCLSIATDDAYDGGGSLQISCGDDVLPFLSTHIRLNRDYLLRYTFKSFDQSDLELQLTMRSVASFFYVINLVGSSFSPKNDPFMNDAFSNIEYPIDKSYLEQIHLQDNEIMNHNFWETRTYILKSSKYLNDVIKKVSARITSLGGNKRVLLGKFEILPLDQMVPTEKENNLKISDFRIGKPIRNGFYINCNLDWKHNSHADRWDLFYKINGRETYINSTCQSFYSVRKLKLNHVDVPVGSSAIIEFILYPLCNGINSCSKLSSRTIYHLTPDYFE